MSSYPINDALSDILKNQPPRERSGSTTAARYAFQINYSIVHVIELVEKGEHFAALFDYFDDLGIVDSITTPTWIKLFQIKGKDGRHWNCTQLCKRRGTSVPRSVVSKMYINEATFGNALVESGFISNAHFHFTLQDQSFTSASDQEISASELHASEQEKILAAVYDDFPNANAEDWVSKIRFRRTSLSVHEQEYFVIGRIEAFMDKCFNSGNRHSSALYKTLYMTVQQRVMLHCDSADGVRHWADKAIASEDLMKLFRRAHNRPLTFSEFWNIAQSDLVANATPTMQIARLNMVAHKYFVKRSTGRAEAAHLARLASKWTSDYSVLLKSNASILDLARSLLPYLGNSQVYNAGEMLAVAVVEIYEMLHNDD